MSSPHRYATRLAVLALALYLAASLGGYAYHAYWAREFAPRLADLLPVGLVAGYAMGVFIPGGIFIVAFCVVACVAFVFSRAPFWFVLLPALSQAVLVFYVINAWRVP